jgi:hypothetical protein
MADGPVARPVVAWFAAVRWDQFRGRTQKFGCSALTAYDSTAVLAVLAVLAVHGERAETVGADLSGQQQPPGQLSGAS